MQFSDLTNKEEENLLEHVIIELEESKFQIYDFQKLWSKKKSNFKASNPATPLISRYKGDHTWLSRNFGSEVRGFSNAKELVSKVGDFQRIIEELNRISKWFEESQTKFDNFIKEIEKASRIIRDDDAKAGLDLKNRFLEGLKKRKEELNNLEKQAKHYEPLMKEAVKKMNEYEAGLAAAKSSKEVSDIKASRKNKVLASSNTDVSYDDKEWKGKVKKMVKAKNDKTTGYSA